MTGLAPSIDADSKTSLGRPPMKLRSRKIANGSPYAVCASQTVRNEPAMPAFLNSDRIGMSVVWSGTTSRPTTITNSTFRPGKVIQAKAYAANAATRTGMIVAGIVMNRLLMNAGPMLLSARTWA